MRLDYHILSDNTNGYVAYYLASLIKEKRPHLEIQSYIESHKA